MARVRLVCDAVWLRGESRCVEELGIEVDPNVVISIVKFQGKGEEREEVTYCSSSTSRTWLPSATIPGYRSRKSSRWKTGANLTGRAASVRTRSAWQVDSVVRRSR